MKSARYRWVSACAVALSALLFAADASAFCGFYVSGADQEMYNNATMVVMMREGTKTVLSMRNNYEGPPEDFAMVIPVPQVLKEENIKTLDDKLFDRVDKLAAPRLVEYFEQDPCTPRVKYEGGFGGLGMMGSGRGGGGFGSKGGLGVKVEAQFDVDEYNVVILSAKESNGLQTWLEQEKYNIPEGAAPLMQPYVEQGQYFFVAKVDPKKVKFRNGQATLSPLRFHYESEDFALPVRLGLINAKGHQDLLVHILAKGTRYETANYKNVSIPTNLIVKQELRTRFANFYNALFDRLVEENPGAVVTEYAWSASSCDPCPVPALNRGELRKLGLDVLEGAAKKPDGGLGTGGLGIVGGGRGFVDRGWVLTRLHARYTATSMKEDLIFRKAEGIYGGRGVPYGMSVLEDGVLGEQRAVPSSYNAFQGRYIMLNPWEGEIKCEDPQRGIWGAPVGGARKKAIAMKGGASAGRDLDLTGLVVTKQIAQLPGGLTSGGAAKAATDAKPEVSTPVKGGPEVAAEEPAVAAPASEEPRSGCQVAAEQSAPGGGMWLLGVLGLLGVRRRRVS